MVVSKVNSQSQSGTSSHSSPLVSSAGLLAARALNNGNGDDNINVGVLQPVDNEALTKRTKVRVHADKNSNAQGQSQITQADWTDLFQLVIPVGIQEEDQIVNTAE